MKKIFLVAGARPNYVKIAAISRAFTVLARKYSTARFVCRIINTGQHYDYLMSKKFFRDLGIPKPYLDLGVGSSSHGSQTALIMTRFEEICFQERPDLVIVVGDVNSTMACSLVAAKIGIPVAHVEAGLRSFDRTMPEEINRMVTDTVSDYLFTSCRDGDHNLIREGVDRKKIFFVGNVMVDTLLANLSKASRSAIKRKLKVPDHYGILTLHRPSNVDRETDFMEIVKSLEHIQRKLPVLFPVHPRTARNMEKSEIGKRLAALPYIKMVPPVGYLDFICLLKDASLVLTDSGGIQEEATVLGVPCLTLRDNTERPVTIREGSNLLAGRRSATIIRLADRLLGSRKRKKAARPELWDGRAAQRIVRILSQYIGF